MKWYFLTSFKAIWDSMVIWNKAIYSNKTKQQKNYACFIH